MTVSTSDVDRDQAALTFAEQRVWLAEQARTGPAGQPTTVGFRAVGAPDEPALRTALTALVRRHPALRLRFPWTAHGPRRVLADTVTVPVTRIDGRSAGDRDGDAVRALVGELAAVPFDLADGPLLRAALVDRPAGERPDDHLVLLAVHGIAADAASAHVLRRDLAEYYAAGRRGRLDVPSEPIAPPSGPEPAVSPARSAAVANRLAELSSTQLPLDRVRPLRRTWAARVLRRQLDPALVDRLAGRLGADASRAVLVAALGAVLTRYTGRDEVVLGMLHPRRSGGESVVGCRTNPVVLRMPTNGDPSFSGLVARATAALRAADAESDVPFDDVLAALGARRHLDRHPLFDITVRCDVPHDLVEGTPIDADPGTLWCDLDVALVLPPGGSPELMLTYAAELFDTDRIDRLGRHLERLLRSASAQPDARISRLPVLGADEHDVVVRRWNATAADYRLDDVCLHELVERRAAARPDAPALRFAGETTTYRQLNERANRLGGYLRRLGAGPETIVGVLLERSPDLPVAVLAILKAGAAYVPLDPDHPADRLAYLADDAGCELVVTITALAGKLSDEVVPICLDEPAIVRGVTALPAENLPRTVRPDNLAYVLYTSGSTGRPKGTLVEHRSVVNLVEYCRRAYDMGPHDRVMQFASPCFDVSVFDIFATLGNGATLVQAPRTVLLDPHALTALLRRERVTFSELPPAVAELLDPAELPDLRMANIGGEALPGHVADRFQAPHRTVHNTYGPTEVTVTSTDYRCPPGLGDDSPPIGAAIANLQAYVVDRFGDPVPVGVPGELLMGGIGVARGYHRRPGLTARLFVPDPFGPPGARVYRTGDLVRWRRDGVLEFLGRIDTQIQVNGQRVEPGEVEAALREHPAVASAVVDLFGVAGDRTLVGFVVPVAGTAAPTTAQMRTHLRDRLPSGLVPSRVIGLDAVPLTLNGKVDRRRLREILEREGVDEVTGSPTLARVAALWADVLGVPPDGVDVRGDLFASGDPVRVAVLRERLRAEFDADVSWPVLLAEPTVAALAAVVATGTS
ncbi:amino acid adenylation domain-containing protein, partial [Actinoplanes sp. NEAU-A12]